MNRTLERIRQMIADWRAVCVFPTEVAAGSWAQRVLDDTELKAVRLDQFISWDTCRLQLLDFPEILEPAGAAVRKIFAADLLRKNADDPQLKVLVPPDYAESSRSFVSSIAAMLPDLPQPGAANADSRSPEGQSGSILSRIAPSLAADIALITAVYQEFLEKAGLYESGLIGIPRGTGAGSGTGYLSGTGSPGAVEITETFSKEKSDDTRRYYIFFPELIPELIPDQAASNMQQRALPAGITLVPTEFPQPEEAPVLKVYDHAGHELAALFAQIRQILDNGADPSDIAVSVGDYNQWYRELEEAADLWSIPLSFRRGKAVAGYPVTRIFRDIQETASQNFSLDSMKKLLLNRACPWTDPEKGAELIRKGIRCSCARNYRKKGIYHDVWEEKLSRAGETDLLSYYRRLSAHIRSITDADSPVACYTELLQFWNDFLDPESWGKPDLWGNPALTNLQQQNDVISFCLDNLRDVVRICTRAELHSLPGFFSLWLSVLDSVWYVPQASAPGIAVYPYGLAAGIAPDYHFIIGMTQGMTEKSLSPLPFLREMEREACEPLDIDLTDIYIKTYAISGKSVRFSCCRRDYSGAQLPAGWFVETGRLKDTTPEYHSDPFVMEQEAWQHREFDGKFPERISPVQKEGYFIACKTALAKKGADFTQIASTDPDLVRQLTRGLRNEAGELVLSPTAVDSFTNCPFNWFLTHALRLEQDDFTLVYTDPRNIGTLIHACYADFYRSAEAKWGPFDPRRLPEYRELLLTVIDRHTAAEAARASAPIVPVGDWVRDFLRDHLPAILDADARIFEEWHTLYTEKKLSRLMPGGYRIEGRLDRAAVRESSGGVMEKALIDFKKNNRVAVKSFSKQSEAPDSYQLPLYALLMQAAGQENGQAAGQAAGQGAIKDEVDDLAREAVSELAYALYYDVTKRTYTTVFPDKPGEDGGFLRMVGMALEAAADMHRKIEAGDFRTVPGHERCMNCRNRDICRGRFAVR